MTLVDQKVDDAVSGRFTFLWDADDISGPPMHGMPPSRWSFADEHAIRAKFWHIRPGDVVLDVGAAFGSYALPAAAKGASRVIAWSPDWNGDLLELSIAKNGWEKVVERRTNALWSKRGWLIIPRCEDWPDFHELGCVIPAGAVACRTLDEDVRGIERVDWLKLDVEGAEVEVLKGAAETIRRTKPKILVEHHLFKSALIEAQVGALLSTMGYAAQEIVPYGSVSHGFYVHGGA